jgi:uncharacterized protein YlxP (DUF503 family)
MTVALGILTIQLLLPGCTSLKEKRSRLKPLLSRLHREFNISTAETDFQDQWQQAIIACTVVSNQKVFNQQCLQKVTHFIETHFDQLEILNQEIELI